MENNFINNSTTVNDGKKKISRLTFLKRVSVFSAFVLPGCSQIDYLIGNYPSKYKMENEINELTLRAFVTTIIPGADENDPNLTRIFTDEYYPFKAFCGFFISDLCSRSKEYFRTEEFFSLDDAKRTSIVESGLNGDSMIKKLYTAAIFMSQVSYFSGIYDDGAGCKLINFDGSNSGFTDEEMFYPDTERYLAKEITISGNYN